MEARQYLDKGYWDNHRQYSRISAKLKMEYRILQKDGQHGNWNLTLTRDVSASGIFFESFHPLSLNTLIEVKLEAQSFKLPLIFKARVVRAIEMMVNDYGVAATITDIKPKDRKMLQQELEQIDISELLDLAVEQGASDIHLSIGHPPILRKAGKLIPLHVDPLDKDLLERMVFSLLTKEHINKFRKNSELNTLVTVADNYRFRLNMHLQQANMEAIFHFIRMPIPKFSELALPEVVKSFARKQAGLVVVTGLAGAGKTTTCAALVNLINEERSCVIMTFEEPCEYIYPLKKSIVRQREIGGDTESFVLGLRHALRQDLDILMVSDTTDIETLEIVLDAAHTGHLVFITFSSPDAVSAVNKIIYKFTAEKQEYIRKMLADCLQGIIVQKLVPSKENSDKQIVATEILVNTPDVAHIIKEGKAEKLNLIMHNDTAFGMCSMEKSLQQLREKGMISDNIEKSSAD